MTKKQRTDTRKWLNRYRFLNKEIQAREKELEEFIRDTYNPLKATVIDCMPKGSGSTSDQTLNTVLRIESIYNNMMQDMTNTIDDLISARKEIEDAINTLDRYERCVIFHRFVLGIYWSDLPAYVGYEQAQCTRYECTALEKVSKMINNDKL